MKVWLAAIGLLGFGTMALSLEVIHEQAIPDDIERSIEKAYDTTRGDWDAFGISRVRVYAISQDANRYRILKDVLEVTQNDSNNLSSICDEAFKSKISLSRCAHHLSKRNDFRFAETALHSLFYSEYRTLQNPSGKEKMLTHLQTTMAFIESFFSSSLVVYRVEGKDYGVNVFQEVMINAEQSYVIIVDHDAGA